MLRIIPIRDLKKTIKILRISKGLCDEFYSQLKSVYGGIL